MIEAHRKIVLKAVETFGAKNQQFQTVEELMELQKAIFENVHRGTPNRDKIVEEVSDVEVMLEQIKIIHDITEHEISVVKDKKLSRLSNTIEKRVKLCSHDPKNKFSVVTRGQSNGRVE